MICLVGTPSQAHPIARTCAAGPKRLYVDLHVCNGLLRLCFVVYGCWLVLVRDMFTYVFILDKIQITAAFVYK